MILLEESPLAAYLTSGGHRWMLPNTVSVHSHLTESPIGLKFQSPFRVESARPVTARFNHQRSAGNIERMKGMGLDSSKDARGATIAQSPNWGVDNYPLGGSRTIVHLGIVDF